MKKILNKITKEKIFNTIIVLIVIALYVAVFMFIYTNFRERKRNEIAKGIINKVDEQIKINKNEENNGAATETRVKYNGFNYTVLGKIRIKKINLYQPILKENTASAYNTALVKMAGPNLNENGNVAIGGHNFMRGNYFIKINRLVKNDVITITDLTGRKVDYYVYEFGVTSKDDASYLSQPDDENIKMITLVTCTKGGNERYYVKARAK